MDCSISTAVPTGSSASIGTPRLGLVPVGDRRYSLGRLPDNARMARCRRRTRRENLHLKDLNRDQRGPSGKTSMVLPPPRAADVHCAAGRLLIWSRCQSPSFDLASWPRMKTAATEWSGEHGLDQHSLPTTRDPVSGVVRLATEEKVRNLKAWRKIAPVADHKPRRDCSISEDPGEAMDPVGLLAERYVTIAVAHPSRFRNDELLHIDAPGILLHAQYPRQCGHARRARQHHESRRQHHRRWRGRIRSFDGPQRASRAGRTALRFRSSRTGDDARGWCARMAVENDLSAA